MLVARAYQRAKQPPANGEVIFSQTLSSLQGIICRSIAVKNPSAAHKLGELIVSRGESLHFFPERYPRVRQRPLIRRFIAGKFFKIFYRIRPELGTVEILRCWDGRRESQPKF